MLKSSSYLPILKAARNRATRGERVLGSLFPQRGYGWPGGWGSDRLECVMHMKNWTYVAINSIASVIAQLTPNMAFVHHHAIPGKTQKAYTLGGNNIGFECHNQRFVNHYRPKALGSVVKPHEDLEPLPASHLLRRLIVNPNPIDTTFDLLYELDMFLELVGTAYIWVVPNDWGVPCELWIIPSHWVWPRTGNKSHLDSDPDAERLIDYYEIRPWGGMGSAGILKFPVDEVIQIGWKSPINKIDGYSKLQATANWIDVEESIGKSRWSQFMNQALPSCFIEVPEGFDDPDDNKIARIEAKFMSKLQGEFNVGRPFIGPAGVKISPLSFNPEQMMYVASEEQIRDMILSTFGVPKTAVGISEGMTYGGNLAALQQFAMWSINPRLAMLGAKLTKLLAPKFQEGEIIRIWWDDCTPPDPAQINADVAQDIAGQAISPNEIRAIRGRQAWANGGDDPMVQGPGGIVPLPLQTGEDLSELAELMKPMATMGTPEQEDAPGMQQGEDEGKPPSMSPGIEEPNGKPSKHLVLKGGYETYSRDELVEMDRKLAGDLRQEQWAADGTGLRAEIAQANVREIGRQRAAIQAALKAKQGKSLRKDLGPHKFSSTQLQLPPELAEAVKAFSREHIAEEDLAEKGYEDDVHITVLYGLHTGDADDVRRVVNGFGPVQVRWGGISVFETDDGDCIVLDVLPGGINILNSRLRESLEYTSKFLEYKPHLTLAYVKPGEGEKYVQLLDGRLPLEKYVNFDSLVFGAANGERVTIGLTGNKREQVLNYFARNGNGHVKKNGKPRKQLAIVKAEGESYFATCDRDDEGHCLPSGQSGATATAEKPAAHKPVRPGFHSLADAPEDVKARAKAMRLPPAWTNTQVSADPDSPLQAVGYDKKGREQRVYSAAHSAKAAAEKFLRVKAFVDELPKLESIFRKDLTGPNSDEAAVLLLMRRTGFRIGSDTDTKTEHEALGATTLTNKNVKVNGDKLTFDFIGKKGVRIKQSIVDPELASIIGPKLQQKGRLFKTSDSKVRDYLHANDGQFKPKDMRTVVAAETALKAIEKVKAPKNAKEEKKAKLAVAKVVAEKLGNTPSVALKSYIPPEIFSIWGGVQ